MVELAKNSVVPKSDHGLSVVSVEDVLSVHFRGELDQGPGGDVPREPGDTSEVSREGDDAGVKWRCLQDLVDGSVEVSVLLEDFEFVVQEVVKVDQEGELEGVPGDYRGGALELAGAC